MGGYNTDGVAWRYAIPPELQNKVSINLLEFLAAAITIQLTLKNSNIPQIILAFTDNSSALGWLYKASFKDCQPVHDAVAWWLAYKLIAHDSALYYQYIKGIYNFISDSLSRDTHIITKQLTHSFKIPLPTQIHQNFRISQLPAETDSWIRSIL